MSDTDDLQRLADLHQRGVLTDDEFTRAKARVLGGHAAPVPPSAPPAADALNAFRRTRWDRWLGGVCGGLGKLTGLPSWVWRIVFVLLVACAGSGFLLYLLLWIFVPQED